MVQPLTYRQPGGGLVLAQLSMEGLCLSHKFWRLHRADQQVHGDSELMGMPNRAEVFYDRWGELHIQVAR